jgi:hypothetical protein
MTRRVVMIVAAWCVTAVGLAGAPEAITVTGCVTQSADSGLLLRAQPSDSTPPRRMSAGSNTSKGSTPIGGAPQMVADRPSAGSTTPKGSTPINRGSRLADSDGSAGANTSKGSTPIRHRAAAATAYELDADAARLSSYVGQTVAITGTTSQSRTTSQSAGAARLTVESMRVIAPGCSY